jgi:hypothetical protein
MSVSSINSGFNPVAYQLRNTQANTDFKDAMAGASSAADSPEQTFRNFMKEPPGQRMIDEWLKAHHLTEQDLKNMTPEKREAIEKQMATDIKDEIERKAQAKAGGKLNITA